MTKDLVESIATEVLSNKRMILSASMRKLLAETPKKDLVQYHDSLGRFIRNEFGLWNRKWEPQLENGVDVSEEHPDEISGRVIERVAAILKKERQKRK